MTVAFKIDTTFVFLPKSTAFFICLCTISGYNRAMGMIGPTIGLPPSVNLIGIAVRK